MTKVINKKHLALSRCIQVHVYSFMVQKKSAMMAKIHTRKRTAMILMALTTVPVGGTMFDPFSNAKM